MEKEAFERVIVFFCSHYKKSWRFIWNFRNVNEVSFLWCQICKLEEDVIMRHKQNDQTEKKLSNTEKDKKNLEKKYEQLVNKATTLAKELKDEKEMNQFLRENQVFLFVHICFTFQQIKLFQEFLIPTFLGTFLVCFKCWTIYLVLFPFMGYWLKYLFYLLALICFNLLVYYGRVIGLKRFLIWRRGWRV